MKPTKVRKSSKRDFKLLHLYVVNTKKSSMRALFWILLIVSSNCWEQTWKEFNPTLGKTIDLSREGEKAFIKGLENDELIDGKDNY